MKEYNIKRDDLDYILTDTLPVELSELYTNIYFYEFLHSRKTEIDEISNEFKKLVFSFSTKNPFMKNSSDNHGIPTIPLTFNILKSDQENKRKMSVPQPLSALEIYFLYGIIRQIYCYHLKNRDILFVITREIIH